MGVTKSNFFSETQNEMASMARALSHPARIAIIDYLLSAGVCINRHLVEETGLAQATISQHLKELKDAGLIRGTIEGTSVSYCMDPEGWERFRRAFGSFLQPLIDCDNSDCC
ncbi:MAG: metalloregulator ArsR/SmtB family transcription factor [Cyclobacteriaceae bacterium]